MRKRTSILAAVALMALAGASAGLAGPAYAGDLRAGTVLSVNGEVTAPASYTSAQLAAH
jgi:hypothetical protein